jgi:hypothetical protein
LRVESWGGGFLKMKLNIQPSHIETPNELFRWCYIGFPSSLDVASRKLDSYSARFYSKVS